MIALITPYPTRPEAVDGLISEVVDLAPASWPARGDTNRRVELFFVNRPTGDGVSVVIGDDANVERVVALGEGAAEYDVHVLQAGPPRTSGTVEMLLGRVVRCDPAAELSFNGDAVPTSSEVWTRALLRAPDHVLAIAVATDCAALRETLSKFTVRATAVDDYDEVAYHFFSDV